MQSPLPFNPNWILIAMLRSSDNGTLPCSLYYTVYLGAGYEIIVLEVLACYAIQNDTALFRSSAMNDHDSFYPAFFHGYIKATLKRPYIPDIQSHPLYSLRSKRN
jgi:hypothetical protein